MNRRRKSEPTPTEESGVVDSETAVAPVADAAPAPADAAPANAAVEGDAAAEEPAAKPRRPRRKRVKPPEPEPEVAESVEAPEGLAANPDSPSIDELFAPLPETPVDPLFAPLTVSADADPLLELLAEPLGMRSVMETAPEEDALSAAPLPVENAERLLLELAEKDVVDAGEPIPLLRRASQPDPAPMPAPARVVPPPSPAPAPTLEAMASYVLVPEASEETAPAVEPDEIPEPARVETRPETAGRGGRRRGQETPKPPRPSAPVPVDLPDLVLVQEALLESVPADWLEEDSVPAETPFELPSAAGPATGRRKRRRGRDQGEAPPPPATPSVGAPPAPITNVMRAEEEAPQRERRDREPKPEQRESRDYKEILINVGERETRIAVMENGRLVELHVEREERVVGGVYKARVSNVLPGMDAAFVDIGLERNAFLYVGDILFDDTSGRSGGDGGAPVRRTSRDIRIKDVARPGQEIMVQVVKGPRGTKGARVSTKMSIPGRYLVLMPEGDHLGVSRKIEDVRERDRLKRISDEIKPKGFGLIVRTEAEGRSETELRQDLDYLTRTWSEITAKNKKAHAPALLHADLGIILKTIRDLFGQDVDKLVVDSRDEYDNAVDMLTQLAPDLVDRVHLYEDSEPILIRYNVEEEIDRLLRRKIWLRNGAYLLLDTTEALTTIDVNTGKFVGTSSLQETILKTNLDAVDEIARQLRLRDIGGMIVLDFIDMASARDRALVMRKLEDAFKQDRTRIKIAHISPLGLVEMTRKRTAEAVTDVMSQVCPYCQGRGRVWSPETMAIQIEREVLRLCAKQDVEAILIHANPEVAATLIGAEGEGVEQLERMIRRPVYIRGNHDYHVEKYEIVPGDMLEMERQMMHFHGGQIVDCNVTKIDLITPPRSAAWANGYFVDLANGSRYQGQTIRARLTDVRRSFAIGEPVPPSNSVDRSEPI